MTETGSARCPMPAGIARAAELLRGGGLVSFPTETVYGLGGGRDQRHGGGADLRGQGAAQVQPADRASARPRGGGQRYAVLDGDALRLAEAFWPGPLTLVLPRAPRRRACRRWSRPGCPRSRCGCPTMRWRRRLLAETGRPVAAPSANPSGRISPTEAGQCWPGSAGGSRRCSTAAPARSGWNRPSSASPRRRCCCAPAGCRWRRSRPVSARPLAVHQRGGRGRRAPGQLASHYAPRAPMRLECRRGPRPASGCSGSGHVDGRGAEPVAFRRSGRGGGEPVSPPSRARSGRGRTDRGVADSRHGLGRAINDRLRRAAAPRD